MNHEKWAITDCAYLISLLYNLIYSTSFDIIGGENTFVDNMYHKNS